MKTPFALSCIFVFIFSLLCPAEPLQPSDEQAYVARYMARFFPRQHLTQMELNDQVAERLWNNYLASLDYERMFFKQQDIDLLSSKIHELDDAIIKGDLSVAFETYGIFRDRVIDRCEYVTELLKNGFDLTKKEQFNWRRKDASWPADDAEWNDLWRKRIKNEFLRQKISELLREEEAKNKPAPDTSTNAAAEASAPVIVPLSPEESISKRYKQLQDIVKDSDSEYVVQKFLTAFANAYDPHSSYLSPSALEDFDIEMKLSLVGIGAVLQAEDGAAKVVSLIPGGPASRDKRDNRLQPGDKIIAVGQDSNPIVDILHWPLTKIVQKIRGEKGSRVVMQVIPASDPSGSTTKIVDLIRDEVKLEEQAVKWSASDVKSTDGSVKKVAVITIPAFYANMKAKPDDPEYRSSADDVAKALQEISTNDIEGVLLDLRNNGGGSLVDAVRMTGLFIHEGPAVQVKESSINSRILNDEDPSISYAGPLVVLVNRLSASASEILAAALADYGRAIIVGDSRTHGKGTVQTVVNVGRDPQLGAIKVTTAVFYRITGDSTQLRGVIPDIHIPSPFDYMELGEDSLKYPVEWNRINSSRYRIYDDLSQSIEKCRELSIARREKSEEFKAYSAVLDQIKKLYESESVPLDMESRLEMSRTERQIAEHQKEFSEGSVSPDDSSPEKKTKDIVLEESLNILVDLISFEAVQLAEIINAPAKVEPGSSLINKVRDWLKEDK